MSEIKAYFLGKDKKCNSFHDGFIYIKNQIKERGMSGTVQLASTYIQEDKKKISWVKCIDRAIAEGILDRKTGIVKNINPVKHNEEEQKQGEDQSNG